MNIKQLKYVCSIVELGSFSAAAAREGVSVQAVSKAMGELESKIGTPLFERGSAGVRPTAFGRSFADRARRVLREWDDFERFANAGSRAAAAGAPFRMGFCVPPFRCVERFVSLISVVSERVIGRKVDVRLLDCTEGVEDLRSGRLDGAITIAPLDEEGVVCGRLGTVTSEVYLAATHPLAARKELSLAELSAYPVFRPTDFSHFSESVVDAYRARGLTSEVYEATLDGADPAFFSERGGFTFIVSGGVGVVDDRFVARPLVRGDMVAIPICLSTPKGACGVDYVAFRRALSAMSLFS